MAQQQNLSEELFRNPPNVARPRVWWHWMNGNITREGILLDMEWMQRIGIGGFHQFDAALNTPQVVPKRLVYMTPEWKDAFRYAIETANKFGFEATIASSPGWSETGGPWVEPADAMKKMVWSKIQIADGKPLPIILPHPPTQPGAFQDYSQSGASARDADFYRDSTVLAYPTPAADLNHAEISKVTVSNGLLNFQMLSDGNINKPAAVLPFSDGRKEVWLQIEYAEPSVIQAVTLATLGDVLNPFLADIDPKAWLSSSDDGIHFKKIVDLPRSSIPERTVSFEAHTAKFFRVVFQESQGTKAIQVSEMVLFPVARIHRFEEKSGFATNANYQAIDTPPIDAQFVVDPKKILDLTNRLRPNGSLDWMPPPGAWTILRMGYSLTGRKNGPAPPEATGLEVDKLNADSVRKYIEKYLATYHQFLSTSLMGDKGLKYMLTDSIEAGSQNWTANMLEEFQSRRGYDPRPWLPTLTGVVVGSSRESDRFLWDFRQTIADLLAQNHYGTIAKVLHEHGMKVYGEALESHRPSLGDDLDMRRWADIPMGAMWTFSAGENPRSTYQADIRGAASVAHIYGQNLVGVESMTSPGPAWGYAPSDLKPVVDAQFIDGANRILIHESSHQPLIDKSPGLSLGRYGQWFNRNETWAEQAKPWIDYLSRASYMLQQGRNYADIAYFYGQEGPLTGLYGWDDQKDAPQGYGFDFVNANVILSAFTVQNHMLITSGGASYRALYLGGRSQRITLPVLLRLKALIEDGAMVVGEKPVCSPSLADDEGVFKRVVREMWGDSSSTSAGIRHLGEGTLWQGITAPEALYRQGIRPDFIYDKPNSSTELRFVHRKMTGGEIYFVSNQKDQSEDISATFRINGKVAELWHPDTGIVEPASYNIVGGLTHVKLGLSPNDSVFVVFRYSATKKSVRLPKFRENTIAVLPQNWHVSFQSGRGAPAELEINHLQSWSLNSDPGVRYFSGHAIYTQSFLAPDGWRQSGRPIWLDLGEVHELAEVTINGKPLGEVWKKPFRVEVTNVLHEGRNDIAVTVTNLWVNRLIGDVQKNVPKTYTFTTQHSYSADSPLRESGLLGPVKLIEMEADVKGQP